MNPTADGNRARTSPVGRRRFLASLAGLLTLPAFLVFSPARDDIVVVNGWFLKRTDLDRNQDLARLVSGKTKPRND